MRKQLELEGVPRKRVSLIPEAEKRVSVEKDDELTDWFPSSTPPVKAGYWEVRPIGGSPDRIVWYDHRGWAWPFLGSRAFEYRGLKAPPVNGYPYYVEGAKRCRVALG